jgi:hypothetical protein
VRRVSQRYGFVVVTWAVLIVMVGVMVQLVRNPALLPSSGAAQAGRPEPAQLGPPSQRPPTGSGTAGNQIGNWSFEQGLVGWRRLGLVSVDRASGGRTSGSAARVQVAGPVPADVGLEAAAAAGAPPGSR